MLGYCIHKIFAYLKHSDWGAYASIKWLYRRQKENNEIRKCKKHSSHSSNKPYIISRFDKTHFLLIFKFLIVYRMTENIAQAQADRVGINNG